jgi:hypothetical protein
MKRMTLSLIYVLTFIGIALSASSVMADDRRSDNVTVSFGLRTRINLTSHRR